jgi:TonB-dependent SusC/RagA subfamily outer membrane receptor
VGKDQVVGSVASVHRDDSSGRDARSLAEMLEKIPGVQVIQRSVGGISGGISVRVRGASNSVMGGEDPLWVVDGMVIHAGIGALIDMNPASIESITVLKDAGSTAIYGSRGANGVILIKTKRKST